MAKNEVIITYNYGSVLLSPYENLIVKCDASGHKSTSVLFQKFNGSSNSEVYTYRVLMLTLLYSLHQLC